MALLQPKPAWFEVALGKPNGKMLGADTTQGIEAPSSSLSGSKSELSKVVFDETPAGLDEAESGE